PHTAHPQTRTLSLHDALPICLGNWSLSNSGNARKYLIPSGTNIASGGYLVIWCDNATNAPGLHSGFTLGRKGENLFLYDANTNRDRKSTRLNSSHVKISYAVF